MNYQPFLQAHFQSPTPVLSLPKGARAETKVWQQRVSAPTHGGPKWSSKLKEK